MFFENISDHIPDSIFPPHYSCIKIKTHYYSLPFVTLDLQTYFVDVVGYENEDWYIPSPALKPEEVDLNLTPDQIREALNYFREYSDSVQHPVCFDISNCE
jgi:hypothetical protein